MSIGGFHRRRLKWTVLLLDALVLLTVSTYHYVRGGAFVDCLIGWLIGLGGTVPVILVGFRAFAGLELGLQRETAERKRMEEALRQRSRELALLDRVGRAFNSTLSLDQVLEKVLEEVRYLLDATACSVWLFIPETEDLICRHAAGIGAEALRGYRLKAGDGIEGWVARAGESLVLSNAPDDARYSQDAGQRVGVALGSALCVPLRVKQDVIGVLEMVDIKAGHFSPADLVLIEPLADSAAVAIGNARLYEEGERQREQLRALAVRLAEAEEAEWQRLARELHDQVGQNLAALGINLNILHSKLSEGAADWVRSRLVDSLALLEQTGRRIRDLMVDLRPPVLDDYGLGAALRWYGEQQESRTGIVVRVQDEELIPRLPPPVEIALFRIFQEALTNVIKHARAAQVIVSVEADVELVRMVVADDGVGFDPSRLPGPGERQRWGLITMAERAEGIGGHCRVESCPGAGARVIVEVAL